MVPIICYWCRGHWWQISASVVDTGGSLSPVANLPLVVHLDLRISPQIVEKILNDLSVISRGLGEDDS